MPSLARASMGLERGGPAGLRLLVDYSWERGWRQLRGRNVNPLSPGQARPDPALGNVIRLESSGRSERHTLHVNAGLMRPQARYGFFAGYVMTVARDDGDSALSVPTTPAGLAGEWGPAAGDVRHRLFSLSRWRFGGGASLGTMVHVESGAPYDITTGGDDNGDTILSDRPEGTGRNRGRGRASVNLDLRLSWSHGFGPERSDGPGATVRVIRHGAGGDEGVPDLPGADGNKRFQLSVYVQAFNALNHTNPRRYSGVLTSPYFGQPLLAEPGRRLELGASFNF